MLVGGESKFGSIEDEGIGGCGRWVMFHAQPRPINLVSNDEQCRLHLGRYLNWRLWLYVGCSSHNACICIQALSVYPADKLQALGVGKLHDPDDTGQLQKFPIPNFGL